MTEGPPAGSSRPSDREDLARTWQVFLNHCLIVVLTTVGADGTPHAVPMEVLVRGDRVYCWCVGTSVKARNVARSGRATIMGYQGHLFVMVQGSACSILDGDENYREIAHGFLQKYDREEVYGNDTLIEITPACAVLGAWGDPRGIS